MHKRRTTGRAIGRTRGRVAIGAALVLSLAAASCGSDDDTKSTTASTAAAVTTTSAATGTTAATETTAGSETTSAAAETSVSTDETTDQTTGASTESSTGDSTESTGGAAAGDVAGCGPESVTPIDDLSADRKPARCEPDAPAPQPLAEKYTVRFSTAFKAEFVAPILLGIAEGEFEKENLDIDVQTLGFSDAVPLMASGDVDIAVGGTEAALFNAIDSGIGIKWALANFSPPSAGDASVPQTGLWVRRDAFSDPDKPDLAELKGKTLASAVGNGSSIAYPIEASLEDAGLTLNDVTVQQIPSTDMVQALENNAVQAAWLLDPYWIAASQNPDFVLVATQPPAEPIGGLYFGPEFLKDHRDAALAFVRAYIRTVDTYLNGDYQADADVMDELSKATDTPVENLDATPALTFDWEIRGGTTDRMQAVFIKLGSVGYSDPIPEDQVVDRSLYLEAVGQAAG